MAKHPAVTAEAQLVEERDEVRVVVAEVGEEHDGVEPQEGREEAHLAGQGAVVQVGAQREGKALAGPAPDRSNDS